VMERECPYCLSRERRAFGTRGNATFVRCGDCASIFMDLTRNEFGRLHDLAFADEAFVADVTSERGTTPDYATWHEIDGLLPVGPLLEVGPGAGHLLAAARESGRRVFAVEASPVHREFIRRTWGIEDVVAQLEELPPHQRFGAIVLFNTIEHVYDVHSLVTELSARLEPNGVILISTANAGCIVVPFVGPYWSMFKQIDHVSLPSPQGLRKLGAQLGLKVERVWTSELPMETPIGLIVAARDFLRETRLGRINGPRTARSDGTRASASSSGPVPLRRRLLRRLMRAAEGYDPTRHVTARLGLAASVKALLRRAA
jgi:2-polyprenyl-3-methyl-5-hydroxy-6-metoxy-1,4-benzoquinol methylase